MSTGKARPTTIGLSYPSPCDLSSVAAEFDRRAILGCVLFGPICRGLTRPPISFGPLLRQQDGIGFERQLDRLA